MWIPYTKAIAQNMTGYPKLGDPVLFKARGGKNPVWYKGTVTKVINLRRYMIRYQVPENVKSSFINGTSSAVVKIDDLSFSCTTVIYENEE